MTDTPVQHFPGRDGVELAYRERGSGRPLVLIHGYFSTATVNWIRYGHAETIAAAGHRVIMPDLRAHGDSAAPHDPARYPSDILTDDALALIDHLGLDDYDLGGYSLGARTVVRMLVRGAAPGRAIVAGMGLDGIEHPGSGNAFFRRVLTGLGGFERGTAEWRSEAFLTSTGGDPEALLHVLDTSVDTSRAELGRVRTPTLVLMGDEDHDHGSGEDLAAALPDGRYRTVPGNHMSAVADAALGRVIAEFLAEA